MTTNYTLDINAGLTQVLADGTRTYLYGRGRIAQVSADSSEYFLGDALGSVRQVADPAAEAVLTQSYQPYGEVLSQHGDGTTSYGFTSEWIDLSGLIHLRARSYDPMQGRFISKDVWHGNSGKPMTYNYWNYGYSNPVTFVDPSGYQGNENGGTPEPPIPTPETPISTSTPGPKPAQIAPSSTPMPEPARRVYWRNLSEDSLLAYQQDQGTTNYCSSYSISTAFNLLYNANTTGMDVVNAIKENQRCFSQYYWCSDGGCVLPDQQARIINNLSSKILGKKNNLPSAITTQMSKPLLINALLDPNRLIIMTFNTKRYNPFSGHAMVLVAYKTPKPDDDNSGFGFLNSGWRQPDEGLTWMSRNTMNINMLYPLADGVGGFFSPSNPHFVSISVNGDYEKPICPVYPDIPVHSGLLK